MQLLDRLAVRIVELRLETPAILTLETARPLSLLAAQAMMFFEPFAQALFRFPTIGGSPRWSSAARRSRR